MDINYYLNIDDDASILEDFSLNESIEFSNVLNENFIKTVKKWGDAKLARFINYRFNKIQDTEKRCRNMLLRHNVDIDLLERTIKSEADASKHVISNTKGLSIKKIKEIVNKLFSKLSSIQWFGKEGDPAEVIPFLMLFVVIFGLKLYLVAFLGGILPPDFMFGSYSATMSHASKFILAAILFPIIEETGKYIAVKKGLVRKFVVIFNITDFLVMSGLMFFLAEVSLLRMVFFRFLGFVTQVGTTELLRQNDQSGQGPGTLAFTYVLNFIRYIAEFSFTGNWLAITP